MKRKNSEIHPDGVSSSMLACLRELRGIRRRVRRLEQDLEKERRTLRHVLQANEDVVLLLDDNGMVLALNGQAAMALGTTAGHAVGGQIRELLPPHVSVEVMSAIKQAVTSGKPVTLLDRTVMPGSVHLRCDPVANSAGKTRRVVVSAQDGSYSGRRQCCLQAAAGHVGDGVVIADGHGRIEYVNSAFEAITGLEAREVIGRGFRSIWGRREDRPLCDRQSPSSRSGTSIAERLKARGETANPIAQRPPFALCERPPGNWPSSWASSVTPRAKLCSPANFARRRRWRSWAGWRRALSTVLATSLQ